MNIEPKEYGKDGCIIRVYNEKKVSAWMNNRTYYIRPDENDIFRFDPERALSIMLHKKRKGVTRCSKCGWEGKSEEFKPGYMAEILCVACLEESANECENDLKTGNICRKCGAPRSRCVC